MTRMSQQMNAKDASIEEPSRVPEANFFAARFLRSGVLRTSRAIALLSALALVIFAEPVLNTAVAKDQRAASAVRKAVLSQEPATAGSTRQLRILTEAQYLNTLGYVFGPDFRIKANFPPLRRTDGLLALSSATAGVTPAQIELYQRAATTVANLIIDPAQRNFLVTCRPANEKASDKACATAFLAEKGRLLKRRALTPAELNVFVTQANDVADTLHNFYAGLSVSLEAMLVSPTVLLVNETVEPDPDAPGSYRLDSHSLASRLSLFLWNAAPDDAILKAAESGELQTAKGRARIVDMMLASTRLEAGVRNFFDDMLGFDDFKSLSKDDAVYPVFKGATAEDAREQTLRTIVDHLITKKKDYRDLFTTHDTFVTPALAAVYGIPARPAWTRYTFPPDSPSAGILTHVSFLALHSHPARTSPTLRGKALRELLLCQRVPSPPPNVDFSAVESPSAEVKTVRARIDAHMQSPSCAGCHKITDPIGLALEHFDGIGRFRRDENGAQIDASGKLDGVSFNDVVGLGQALHNHPALPSCLVRRVYSYGISAPTNAKDKNTLEYFNARFAEEKFTFPALLRSIALSAAFSRIAEPSVDSSAQSSQSGGAANSK